MSTVSHQTIRLSKGKHSSPHDGACVMELASMLAGESFTDHPESVCPAIGSFLRAYNDAVEDDRRQDLYAYAANVVGTRSSPEVERARSERLVTWAVARQPSPWVRLIPFPLRSLRPQRRPPVDAAGTHAVQSIRRHTDESHAAVLALLEELLELGATDGRADAAKPSEKAQLLAHP
jgi:hypothetical protein